MLQLQPQTRSKYSYQKHVPVGATPLLSLHQQPPYSCTSHHRQTRELGVGGMVRKRTRAGRMDARTLSTLPVSRTGCDAPMKSLIRLWLTRGDTDSVDISS